MIIPLFVLKGFNLIQEYLESKGLTVKENGFGDHIYTHCMFHGEDEDKRGRLYINILEGDPHYGLFDCKVCGEHGSFNRIRYHYGDSKVELEYTPDVYNPLYNAATEYYHERLMENVEAYNYLNITRGISEEQIAKLKIGWADGGLSNYLLTKNFPSDDIKEAKLVNAVGQDAFQNTLVFPYLSYGNTMLFRTRKLDGKTISMAGVKQSVPYNLDSIRGEETVFLTEGEFDTATLNQYGYPTIGLPGVQTFKAEWMEYLEEAKRIYIVFDQDKAGWAGAEKLSNLIGSRSRVVELPNKGSDVNDFFVKEGKQKEDFDYLIHKAKGGILVSVQEAYDQWQDFEGNPNLENIGLRFNIPALDRQMNWGLLPGDVFLTIGKPGSGKTTLALNYFQRWKMLKPDIKILFVSLEQTRNSYFDKAIKIAQFYNPELEPLDVVDEWSKNIMLIDKNRITQDQLYESIEQYAYETGYYPDVVCIDYLGYYSRSFEGNSEYDQLRAAIMGVKELAKDTLTRFFVPVQSNRTGQYGSDLQADQAKGASTIEDTADFYLSLFNAKQLPPEKQTEDSRGKVYQTILKSRHGDINETIEYLFCPLSMAMVPIDDELIPRARLDIKCKRAFESQQDFIKRLRTGDFGI